MNKKVTSNKTKHIETELHKFQTTYLLIWNCEVNLEC